MTTSSTPPFRPGRPVLLGVLLAAVLLAGAALLPHDPPAPEPPRGEERAAPIAVLRAWDQERTAAWRAGDVAALRRLYVAGSRAGRADRAMLEAYLDRGLRVTGLRMQLAAARVERADGDRLVLRVTDRLSASATATGRDGTWPLPRDGWSSRRVELVRSDGRWRVASVTPQASPAASTASTSASENR